MALAKTKYMDGTSKLEKLDFSGETFTDPGAVIFNGPKISDLQNKIKAKLNEISALYETIQKGYADMIKTCGVDSKGKATKIDTSKNEVGKALEKFKKSADKRADYCKSKKTKLSNTISSILLAITNIDTTNTNVAKGADTTNASATEE